jgi:hypothetical protein
MNFSVITCFDISLRVYIPFSLLPKKNNENENNLNLLYFFFWMISLCLKFMCRRFGTLCSTFIGRVNKNNKMEQFPRVFIQVKVWLKRSLRQLGGGDVSE